MKKGILIFITVIAVCLYSNSTCVLLGQHKAPAARKTMLAPKKNAHAIKKVIPASRKVVPAAHKTVAAAKKNVNINNILQKEIKDARKKEIVEEKQQAKKTLPAAAATAAKVQVKNDIPFYKKYAVPYNVLAFLSGSGLILLFLVIKRLTGGKRKSKSAVTENINLLRQEKLIIRTNDKKSPIRERLVTNAAQMDLKEFAIPQKAKELNLSQGEILLAARIKTYEMAKACSNKY